MYTDYSYFRDFSLNSDLLHSHACILRTERLLPRRLCPVLRVPANVRLLLDYLQKPESGCPHFAAIDDWRSTVFYEIYVHAGQRYVLDNGVCRE